MQSAAKGRHMDAWEGGNGQVLKSKGRPHPHTNPSEVGVLGGGGAKYPQVASRSVGRHDQSTPPTINQEIQFDRYPAGGETES